jgi:SAM-dependent methyltransferase
MKWNPGPPNPRDPWTRFRSYKWLVTRSLARTIARVGHHAHGRVLDVGCGDKRFARQCGERVTKYIGLDYPTTFAGRDDNVEVFGTALALPFASATFDTVVSFEVLEHVTNPRAMVEEIARVVRPGGRVILTTPFLWGEHCQPHDYFRFTLYGLRQLFEDAGLEVLVQERANGFWTLAGERLCYYLWPVYGRRLGWLHTAVSFMILVCASLLEQLHPSDTDYTTSVIVGLKPTEAES